MILGPTLELLCSFSLAELRTFLLTQPAIKRVRMTLEDEAKWQMCEKRARLPIIEALLQSDPSTRKNANLPLNNLQTMFMLHEFMP